MKMIFFSTFYIRTVSQEKSSCARAFVRVSVGFYVDVVTGWGTAPMTSPEFKVGRVSRSGGERSGKTHRRFLAQHLAAVRLKVPVLTPASTCESEFLALIRGGRPSMHRGPAEFCCVEGDNFTFPIY